MNWDVPLFLRAALAQPYLQGYCPQGFREIEGDLPPSMGQGMTDISAVAADGEANTAMQSTLRSRPENYLDLGHCDAAETRQLALLAVARFSGEGSECSVLAITTKLELALVGEFRESPRAPVLVQVLRVGSWRERPGSQETQYLQARSRHHLPE